MKKLSKKIFLLPLCALIANPFSAAFAVKTDGKSDYKHHSSAGYEKKCTRKPKFTPVMTEKKIEGCFKNDEDLDTVMANKFVGLIEDICLNRDSIFFKSGLLFVIMDEGYKELATLAFRDRHDLKEFFDARIARYSDLLHRVNLSEDDRGCLDFVFTALIADIVKDLSKYPKEERTRHLLEEFTRRLMSSDEVRGICGKYPLGDELLAFLYNAAHMHLDTSPKFSAYSLFHCLRMLLA